MYKIIKFGIKANQGEHKAYTMSQTSEIYLCMTYDYTLEYFPCHLYTASMACFIYYIQSKVCVTLYSVEDSKI